jgi:hypothetical protein
MICAAIGIDISRRARSACAATGALCRAQPAPIGADGFVVLATSWLSLGQIAPALLTLHTSLVARSAGVTTPVDAVAGSDDGIVILTEAGARILDPSGVRLRTFAPPPARTAGRRRMEVDGSTAAPGLPADADWARSTDAESIADADDPRLADETDPDAGDTPAQPSPARRSRDALPARDAVIAVGAQSAWLGLPDGLWKVYLATGTAERVVLSGLDPIGRVTASSDGRVVAFVQGQRLYRSRDGGQSFDFVAALGTSPGALAATNTGAIVLLDPADGIARVVAPDGFEFASLPVGRATEVVPCGADALLRGAGTLFVVRWFRDAAAVEPVPGAPGDIGHLACSANGGLWVSSGHELRWSHDRGRSWPGREDPPPGAIAGVAIAGSTIWLAASSGLWTIPARSPPSTPGAQTCGARFIPVPGTGSPTVRRPWSRSSPWWSSLLPRVDLLAAIARHGGRRDMRGMVLLTFSLDHKRVRATERSADLLHPDHGAAAAGFIPIDPAEGAPDEDLTAAEELDALIRVQEESP